MIWKQDYSGTPPDFDKCAAAIWSARGEGCRQCRNPPKHDPRTGTRRRVGCMSPSTAGIAVDRSPEPRSLKAYAGVAGLLAWKPGSGR